MKRLREGISTGSCAAAAAVAAAVWQIEGACPRAVSIEAPIGRTLTISVEPLSYGVCYVEKDAGDDPDVTHGCHVVAQVELLKEQSEIEFYAGEGIGTITEKGLKLPVGEPAINPVPRQMIRDELKKVIGSLGAKVTISIPGGADLAKRTFNPKLGIVGGLSILGTTGIVRPMSEEAVKDSLLLELKMRYEQGFRSALFVLGSSGEKALIDLYGQFSCVILVGNYIGFMLEQAADIGYDHVMIGGFVGKLVKLAGGIMNTHSHVADGRLEILCTHAALEGASTKIVKEIYSCRTTSSAMEVLNRTGFAHIWKPIIEKAARNCREQTRDQIKIGLVFLDSSQKVLAVNDDFNKVLEEVRE